jgi:hypothetical protein
MTKINITPLDVLNTLENDFPHDYAGIKQATPDDLFNRVERLNKPEIKSVSVNYAAWRKSQNIDKNIKNLDLYRIWYLCQHCPRIDESERKALLHYLKTGEYMQRKMSTANVIKNPIIEFERGEFPSEFIEKLIFDYEDKILDEHLFSSDVFTENEIELTADEQVFADFIQAECNKTKACYFRFGNAVNI